MPRVMVSVYDLSRTTLTPSKEKLLANDPFLRLCDRLEQIDPKSLKNLVVQFQSTVARELEEHIDSEEDRKEFKEFISDMFSSVDDGLV
jgi:hypothetical protein